ncbi:hypothetical protein [Bacillus sp. ISL-45]|nr:hypothetical protein [Bacillus sp. ISL-45]MBT2637380.1 hypothetical protein [Bacillus sp. ISL-39]MBT2660453.1 hypothetical protein [Bacillus sp. ISL-45]
MKIVFVYRLILVGAEMELLISVPGTSLSAGKNFVKAQLPAFTKSEFFLGLPVSLLGAIRAYGVSRCPILPHDFEELPRTFPRTMEMR